MDTSFRFHDNFFASKNYSTCDYLLFLISEVMTSIWLNVSIRVYSYVMSFNKSNFIAYDITNQEDSEGEDAENEGNVQD